jgi:hypothetical protein
MKPTRCDFIKTSAVTGVIAITSLFHAERKFTMPTEPSKALMAQFVDSEGAHCNVGAEAA